MPDNNKPRPSAVAGKISFRKHYDELERRRVALADRLDKLGEYGRGHPSFRKATTLLTRTFRDAKLVQRAAILQAADWIISLIEAGMPFV
ncbi:MAG: hypothetical protein RO009_18720 [Pseudorhodoplanes sp.]|jgi:hypothetical protein|nr:hypothetical protein [Pseudorhodoplanes sp.]